MVPKHSPVVTWKEIESTQNIDRTRNLRGLCRSAEAILSPKKCIHQLELPDVNFNLTRIWDNYLQGKKKIS